MKLLLISDVESQYLWDFYRPGRLDGYDLILSCGDLDAQYLSFLVTMARCPLLYVHGNHDAGYDRRPPEGCDCVDGRLVTVGGLRILGLGGSIRYSGGPHQYTEREMARRIARLRPALWRAGGVDIVLTHSPPRGVGDAEDAAHRGFACFNALIARYAPRYLVHGHVHRNYAAAPPRALQSGATTVLNACERCELEWT